MLDTRFDDWEYLDGDNIRIYYRYSKSRAEKLLFECEQLLLTMAPIIDISSSSNYKESNEFSYNLNYLKYQLLEP